MQGVRGKKVRKSTEPEVLVIWRTQCWGLRTKSGKVMRVGEKVSDEGW